MLTHRKLEIIAAVLILILLVILLAIVLRDPKQPAEDTTPDTDKIVQTMPEVNPADIPAPGMVSASTVTRIFVERFGSYSSESDFANVDDVMPLATPQYQAELEVTADNYRRQAGATDVYNGISTQVITLKATSETESATTFLVTTQREEAVGTPGNTTLRYQDAEVSLVKSGDEWLVNDLAWK